MKEIELTRGKSTRVDDLDFDWLSQWRWCVQGSGDYLYAVRGIEPSGKHRKILMHREITKAEPGLVVDHIDHDTLNNTRANLRICTHQNNVIAHRLSRANKSGFTGVFFNKSRRKWDAQIKLDGKSIHLGRFKTPEEAALQYNKVALEKHGEFARLNAI